MPHPFTTLLLLAPLVLASSGCASKQRRTCILAGSCGDKSACVEGVCSAATDTPVETKSRRLVLSPTQLAVVGSRTASPWQSAEIPFGRDDLGDVVLLLQFPKTIDTGTEVDAAWLVLDPVAGAMPCKAPVQLVLSRIVEPWTATTTTWARQPALELCNASIAASNWGQRSLRIDVTSQVRRWREHRSDDHGLAITASAQDPYGARYALGTGGDAAGPRLDLYLR